MKETDLGAMETHMPAENNEDSHSNESDNDLSPTQPLDGTDENGNGADHQGTIFVARKDAAWGYLDTLNEFFNSAELRKTTFVFGRNKNLDYVVPLPPSANSVMTKEYYDCVSRKHFTIEKVVDTDDIHETSVVLHDHSTRGTYVNGQLIGKNRSVPLVSNSIIAIAFKDSMAFKFLMLDEDEDEEKELPDQGDLKSRLPTQLLDRYVLGSLLGHGSGGTVYLGYKKSNDDLLLDNEANGGASGRKESATVVKVAIKLVPRRNNRHHSRIEGDILQKIPHHACITNIIDLFENDHYNVLVMEYAKGGELFTYVENDFKSNNFNERVAKLQFYQILKGTQHLHESNVCHRDLKLENILMGSKSRTALVKITDFGLSKESTTLMTSYVGTKSYMAPEVIGARSDPRGVVNYTTKADMWSLGCVLYSLLSGTPAFVSDTSQMLEDSILLGDINMEGSRWETVSAEAKDLVSKLLEVESSRRLSAQDALEHEWFTQDQFVIASANNLMSGKCESVDEVELRRRLTRQSAVARLRPHNNKRRRQRGDDEDLQEATKMMRIQ